MTPRFAIPCSALRQACLLSFALGTCVTSAFGGPSATITLVPSTGTLAGNGSFGFTTGPGVATATPLEQPIGLTTDAAGNIYFADGNLDVVWKLDRTTGIMSVIAGIPGPGRISGDGGPATSAHIQGPEGVRMDRAGNLYVVDTGGFAVRKVDASGTITTVAGTPRTPGYTGDGGLATSATLGGASYIALDHSGNLYIADLANNVIRRVDATTHIISTFAGNNGGGATTGDGDVATNTKFNIPNGIEFDSKGNLYICERGNNVIRMVAAGTGIVSTVAGNQTAGSSGDGGAATSAELNTPWSISLDSNDNLYIADFGNATIRRVDALTHVITTVAGTTGNQGYAGDGGAASSALFDTPTDLLFDKQSGNLYVADPSFNLNKPVVRGVAFQAGFPNTAVGSTSSSQNLVLNITGILTINSITVPASQGGTAEYAAGSLSGTGCSVGSPIAGGTNCTLPATFSPRYPGIRHIPLIISATVGGTPTIFRLAMAGDGFGPQAAFSPSVITTAAGNNTLGYSGDGGPATAAAFDSPAAVVLDYAGNLYISDTGNNVVRRVDGTTNLVTTIAGDGSAGYSGDGGAAAAAELNTPYGLTLDGVGNLYVSDSSNNVIRQVDASTAKITTVAGIGDPGYTGDNDFAVSATLHSPYDLIFNNTGNYFLADYQNSAIRRVEANQLSNLAIINTIAGDGSAGSSADGLLASDSLLDLPSAITIDSAGNLYIADSGNFLVRKIAALGGGMNTVAGSGAMGSSGDGGAATSAELKNVLGLAVDSAGNLYIADSGNNVLREVNATSQIIRTLAGDGAAHTSGYSGDGGVPTSALLSSPEHPALDSAGNLYFADTSNHVIRKIGTDAAPLTFTATALGTSSSAQDVTITNNGNSTLSISALTLPADFNLSGSDNTCTPSTSLSPGASCVLGIAFAPIVTGPLSETITVTDNLGTQTVSLSGTGLPAIPMGTSTSTALTISPNPATTGQTIVFTAAVTPAPAGPSRGTVSFYNGEILLGAGAVNSSGVATLTITSLTVNSYNITAAYSGVSGVYLSSTSASQSLTVGKAAVIVTVPALQVASGQTGTVVVTVTGPYQTLSAPSGSVSYVLVNASATTVASGVLTLTAGSMSSAATVSISSTLAAGTYTLKIVAYSGDSSYASSSSVLATASIVIGQITPAISWSPLSSSVPYGSTLSGILNAQASNGSSAVAGTFVYTATPSGGSGSTVTSASVLGGGSYVLTATFTPADTAGYKSASGTIPFTVNKAGATSTLVSSATPVFVTTAITFTSTVSSSAGTPTGSVDFYDGTTLLGSASLANGTGIYATSSLASGTHSITAVYAGDTNFAGATSSAIAQVVQDFSLGTPGSGSGVPSQSILPGGTAAFPLVLGPTNGDTLAAPVSLTVTGAPPGATATLNPNYLPAGASLTNVVLTVVLPRTTAEIRLSDRPGERLRPMLWGMLLLPFALRMRRAARKLSHLVCLLMVALAGTCLVLQLSGCGTTPSGFFGQQQKTYTLVITATSGTVSRSTHVNLTVQ